MYIDEIDVPYCTDTSTVESVGAIMEADGQTST